MMSAITINRKPVIFGHDHDGLTPEYFWQFLLNEYIPAYQEELTDNEVAQIHKGIEEKKDHIYIWEYNSDGSKKCMTHTLIYARPCFTFDMSSEFKPICDFSGL